MHSIDSAGVVFRELTSLLQSAKIDRSEAKIFTESLRREMSLASLSQNTTGARDISPAAELQALFGDLADEPTSSMLEALQQLEPLCNWFRADRFYPEPRYKEFAENVWGALLAGQDDALFGTQDRYIALLIVIGSNTTYPLHAHRIEELYYVLSGSADWSHDGEHWTTLNSGSVFFNHSYQPHTMRTGDQPVMAMGLYLPPFGWEGGLLEEISVE